jgi:hypothetical protein
MRQMVYSVSMTKKKYFHEVIEEEEKILAIGLKQSRLHKKERLDKEKSKRFPTADERWPRRGIVIKND